MKLVPLMLAASLLMAACGGSGDGASDMPTPQPPESVPSRISVTRAQCTPFGASPRPVVLANARVRALCQGGARMADWVDPEGTMRQACLYEPPGPATRLPLLVYLHPSQIGPDGSLEASNIRSQLATADLSGDPNRPGFILLAPVGRVTERFYPAPDDVALGWDNWYRQLLPDGGSRRVNDLDWPQNVDAATVDHYIDEVVAGGKVDPERIYLIGWSNGSALGIVYALNRPEIAAAAVYSSPNPLRAFNDPCPQAPVADAPVNDTQIQLLNPEVPIYHVHNDCDFAGICPTAFVLRNSLLAGGLTDISDQIIDSAMSPVDACVPLSACTLETGSFNHTRWATMWTEVMFRFLREHPLSP